MAPAPEGNYQMGFQITPLVDGGLDTSGDFKGGPHPAEDDPLYNMALENRDGGNKMVQAGQYEIAIGRYSELIMQTRALDNEPDVEWTDDSRIAVRQLRAAAYLNLSLCFLKTEQWTHASNTATRALQGDKDPADPQDDVLAPEKKAKALFRRAQAQSQGFGNYTKAQEDLQQALKHTPEDKTIQKELTNIETLIKKAAKAADKKLAGFLNSKKAEEGIFTDDVRPEDGPKAKPGPTEPMKLSDGLWVMPGMEEKPKVEPNSEEVDFEELSREITEMQEACPDDFAKLREQVQNKIEEELKFQEEESKKNGSNETPEQNNAENEAKEKCIENAKDEASPNV